MLVLNMSLYDAHMGYIGRFRLKECDCGTTGFANKSCPIYIKIVRMKEIIGINVRHIGVKMMNDHNYFFFQWI